VAKSAAVASSTGLKADWIDHSEIPPDECLFRNLLGYRTDPAASNFTLFRGGQSLL
jgi:hypothetical protein